MLIKQGRYREYKPDIKTYYYETMKLKQYGVLGNNQENPQGG